MDLEQLPSYLKLKYTKWENNIYNKSDDQLLIMQAMIEANRKNYDEKMNNLIEDLTAII